MEIESGDDSIVGYSPACTLVEPFLGIGNGPAFRFRFRFIIHRSVGENARNGVKQRLEHSHNSGDLGGRQAINQFVRLLLSVG